MSKDVAKITAEGRMASFNDGTVWPIPSNALGDVEWQLRYGNPESVKLVAASVIAAYGELIRLPQKDRQKRVMVLRAAARMANIRNLSDDR